MARLVRLNSPTARSVLESQGEGGAFDLTLLLGDEDHRVDQVLNPWTHALFNGV
jgi:hypothetical protein